MRRFLSNRAGVLASAFVIALIAIACLASVLAPQDPSIQDLRAKNSMPSPDYLLGADLFGRDILSRLIAGVRVTMLASAIALIVAVVLGAPAGLIAGFRGDLLDAILGRAADALLSLPPLILALAIIGVVGPGLTSAMVAVGVVLSPRFFRVARAASATASQEAYVEAARADGCSSTRLIVRHVLPNAAGALVIQASFALGFIIGAEASLSFLGLGVQFPTPSWGSMIREAFSQTSQSSFQLFPPTILITLTVLAFAVIGDALRDAFGRASLT